MIKKSFWNSATSDGNNQISQVVVQVGMECNMSCAYCYQSDTTRLPYMEEGVARKIASKLSKLLDKKIFSSMLFSGGEIFLNRGRFFKIYNVFKSVLSKKGFVFDVYVETNGLNLDDEIINFIIDNKIVTTVSMDGYSYTHNEYRKAKNDKVMMHEKVMDGIKKLIKRGGIVNISCSIHDKNINDIFKIYGFFVALGASSIRLLPVFLGGVDLLDDFVGKYCTGIMEIFDNDIRTKRVGICDNPIKLIADVVNLQKNTCFPCAAGSGVIMINPKGDIYPCDGLFDDNESFRMGSIFDAENSIFKKKIPTSCSNCEYLSYCEGACPAASKSPYKEVSPMVCKINKKLIPYIKKRYYETT